MLNPVEIAQSLIKRPSISPNDAGCLDEIQAILQPLGFRVVRKRFGDVENMYARLGTLGKNFCFAGHTDVVPVGDKAAWQYPPFEGAIADGRLYGRGISDMKGAIACYLVALVDRLEAQGDKPLENSFSLLLTSDEEGDAIHGTREMVEWLKSEGENLSACLIGEPTNPNRVGEMIKVGRRGSLHADITVKGKMGHVAYPHLAQNPIPSLTRFLYALNQIKFEDASDDFDASNLEVTTIDVGNTASNVIPRQASATFNIRFTPTYSGAKLESELREVAESIKLPYDLKTRISGEPFLCDNKSLQDLVYKAVFDATREEPVFSTTGGTSDARFIKEICPTIEFGLVSETAHQVDENVSLDDLDRLTAIYSKILEKF